MNVVIQNNLTEEEVVFILHRGIKISTTYQCFVFPEEEKKLRSIKKIYSTRHSFRNFYQIRSLIQKIDSFIKKITNDNSFAIYLPHSFAPHFHLMSTHKNCCSISYIEEGMLSYTHLNIKPLTLKQRLNKLLLKILFNGRIRIYSNPWFENSNIAYCLHNSAFQNFTNKVYFENGFDVVKNYHINFHNKTMTILSLPPYQNFMYFSTFLSMLFNFLKSSNEYKSLSIYFKLHPDDALNVELTNFFKAFFRCNFHNEFIMLGSEMCIECLFQRNNITVITYGSSVSWYAKMNAATVVDLKEISLNTI